MTSRAPNRKCNVRSLWKDLISTSCPWVVIFCILYVELRWKLLYISIIRSSQLSVSVKHSTCSFLLSWHGQTGYFFRHYTWLLETKTKKISKNFLGFFSYFASSYSIFIEIWQMNTMFIKGSLYGEKFLLIVTVVIQYPN